MVCHGRDGGVQRPELVLEEPAGRRLRHEGHAHLVGDEDDVAGPGGQRRTEGSGVVPDEGVGPLEVGPRLGPVDEPGQPRPEAVEE